MTFLEFVCEELMGPPAHRSSGSSYWLCPIHKESHPSFHTLPPMQGKKDRYKCFGCGAWGDEYDILKEFFPKENFTQRRERLNEMRRQYEQQHAPVYSFRGSGSTHGTAARWNMPSGGEIDEDDVLEVRAKWNHQRMLQLEALVLAPVKKKVTVKKPAVKKQQKRRGK